MDSNLQTLIVKKILKINLKVTMMFVNLYCCIDVFSCYCVSLQVEEALAMFEDVMMVRDRVMPRRRTFITLLGILGRAGHTDKAFHIFRQVIYFVT